MDERLVLNANKEENKDIIRNVKFNLESASVYNPSIFIEKKELKKHNSLKPIRRIDSVLILKNLSNEEQKANESKLNESKLNESKIRAERLGTLAQFSQPLQRKKTIDVKENEDTLKEKRAPESYKAWEKFIDSTGVMVFMTVLTIFALFGSDIQSAWLTADVDLTFDIIQCLLVFFFTLEIVIASIVKKNYLVV